MLGGHLSHIVSMALLCALWPYVEVFLGLVPMSTAMPDSIGIFIFIMVILSLGGIHSRRCPLCSSPWVASEADETPWLR